MSASPSGFSQEELQSFMEVENPAPVTPVATGQTHVDLTPIQNMIHQTALESQRAIGSLRNEFQSFQQHSSQEEETPAEIPIRFGQGGRAFVSQEDLQPFIEKEAQNRFQQNLVPFLPALQENQRNSSLNQAIDFVKQTAPELLEGRDASVVGQAAIDFYNSGFNSYQDPNQRTEHAVSRLRQTFNALPASTGNLPQGQIVQAFNQTGRTQATMDPQEQNPWGLQRGASINIKPKSINDLGGIDEYTQYAANIDALHRYNDQYNMGWKFNS